MPKIHQSTDESVYFKDGPDGKPELTEKRTNVTMRWGDEPPYVKMYLQDILYLSDVPVQYEKLILALLKRCTYASTEHPNCVILNSTIKKIICKEMGWKRISSLDNAIQKLLRGQIVRRIDTGVYEFNPHLFGRGEWQDIAKIRLNVQYDLNGKTFNAFVKQKEKDQKEAEAQKEASNG